MPEHNHDDIYNDLDRQSKKIKDLENQIRNLETKANLREIDSYSNLGRIQVLEDRLEKGY